MEHDAIDQISGDVGNVFFGLDAYSLPRVEGLGEGGEGGYEVGQGFTGSGGAGNDNSHVLGCGNVGEFFFEGVVGGEVDGEGLVFLIVAVAAAAGVANIIGLVQNGIDGFERIDLNRGGQRKFQRTQSIHEPGSGAQSAPAQSLSFSVFFFLVVLIAVVAIGVGGRCAIGTGADAFGEFGLEEFGGVKVFGGDGLAELGLEFVESHEGDFGGQVVIVVAREESRTPTAWLIYGGGGR